MDVKNTMVGRSICYFIFLFGAICIFFVSPSHANSGLSLNQLSVIAIQNNKDLRAATYSVALAKSRLTQAGQLPNPTLELLNTDDRAFKNEGEYTRSVGFSQEFPVAGRIGRQKEVARVDVAIAQAEIADAERKLRVDVAKNFYTLLVFDRRLAQLDRLSQINYRLMQGARHRYRAAEVSELDVNTAKLEYQKLSQEKKILISQRLVQLADLNTLLGRPAKSALILDETLPHLPNLPDLISLQKLALERRPDFLAANLTICRAQADMALARAQRWADWKLGIGVEQDKLIIEGAPPQSPDRSLAISLSIPLPLLNQNQGRIQEASSSEIQAYERIQALKLTIESEVTSNYNQVQYLQTVINQSQISSIPIGEKNIRLAQQAYNMGQISIFEMVQMQRQYYELQRSYLDALDQYLQAFVKLQSAIGGDLYVLTRRETPHGKD